MARYFTVIFAALGIIWSVAVIWGSYSTRLEALENSFEHHQLIERDLIDRLARIEGKVDMLIRKEHDDTGLK